MKYKPMLAKIGNERLLDDTSLIFEPKLDGVRALCEVSPKGMKLYSRNGHNITAQFPEFQFRKAIHAKRCILDGEIVVYDKKGTPNFNHLQGRTQLTGKKKIVAEEIAYPATYAVFDILSRDGISLLRKPYLERHRILHETVIPAHGIELLNHSRNGHALFKEMKRRKFEGVIAKKPNAPYSPGKRTSAWQKVKFLKSVECVVVGYTQKKKVISSLILGLYDKKGNLVYTGHVGTGFSQEKIAEIYPKLQRVKSTKPYVAQIANAPDITFVKPALVVEISYLERTKAGALRHAAYQHLRYDKKPKECTTDQF